MYKRDKAMLLKFYTYAICKTLDLKMNVKIFIYGDTHCPCNDELHSNLLKMKWQAQLHTLLGNFLKNKMASSIISK